jgi:hypothetical protein
MNHSRTQLDMWDSSGNYLSTLALREETLSLGAIAGFSSANNIVLFGGLRGGTGSRIAVIDTGIREVLHEFEWNQLPDVRMPSRVSAEAPVRAERGVILVGSGAGYQFRVYGEDGSLRRHVARAVSYPVRAGYLEDDIGQGIWSFGEVLAPMYSDPDYLLVCVTWVEAVEDPDALAARGLLAMREGRPSPPVVEASSFDLYDREGRLLFSLVEAGGRWPTTGVPQFIGPRQSSLHDRRRTISADPSLQDCGSLNLAGLASAVHVTSTLQPACERADRLPWG